MRESTSRSIQTNWICNQHNIRRNRRGDNIILHKYEFSSFILYLLIYVKEESQHLFHSYFITCRKNHQRNISNVRITWNYNFQYMPNVGSMLSCCATYWTLANFYQSECSTANPLKLWSPSKVIYRYVCENWLKAMQKVRCK